MLKASLNRESTVLGFCSIARQKMEHPPHHMLHRQTMWWHPRHLPPNVPLPHGHKPKNNLIHSIRSCNLLWHVNSWFKNTQGAGAGKLLISHLCKDDNVGQIISDSFDALQIHARTSWPVLSQGRTQVCRYVCCTNQTTVSNGTVTPGQPNYGNSMMPMNTWYTVTNRGSETNEMATPSS
jgi:hypothetical protein